MNLGKEFYTIEAASGKVFYLIIDRDGEEELVYFLTEITENDLLNVTTDNSETLPKNSAALESQIPITESALPNNNTDYEETHEVETPTETPEEPEEPTEEEPKEEPMEPVKSNPLVGYLIMGILGAGVIGAAYYFKVVKKKQDGDFVEDEDEEDDDEDYETEEEESESEDNFFENEREPENGREQERPEPTAEDVADTIGDDETESDSEEE